MLTGAWLSGNTLWSIDLTNNYLLYFEDTLSGQVKLCAPSDRETVKAALSGDTIKNISLDWEPLEGAGSYQWQLSDDDGFSSSSIISEDTTGASSVKLNQLEPDETYYWRIRAVTPLLSPWSGTWSFTPQVIIEPNAPLLESPAAGAVNVPVNTMFQWTAVDGAERYELEISTQYDFSNPVVRLAGISAMPVNRLAESGSILIQHHLLLAGCARLIRTASATGAERGCLLLSRLKQRKLRQAPRSRKPNRLKR